jgi:RHS repeat-associated protein
MTSQKHTRTLCRIAGLAILTVPYLYAQGQPSLLAPNWPQISDRGIVAGRTFDISDIENISIETGNLFLTIPLAALPPGPGGSSYSVGLVYNSQIYDSGLGTGITLPDGTATAVPTILTQSTHGGGWSYSFQYSLQYDVKSFPNASTNCLDSNKNWYRLSVIFPDGSQHLLHPRGYDSDADGYFTVSPSGTLSCGAGTVSGTLVYYTDDGAFSRLELQVSSGSWVLYRPDGSQVVGVGVTNPQVSQIVDRNGNAITFSYAAPGGIPAVTIRDSSGNAARAITISSYLSPITAAEQTVTGPGANDALLTWKVKWDTTSPTYSLDYPCVLDNRFNNCTTTPVSNGIASIELPKLADANTLTYQFLYNSTDADHGRGELKSVTTPLGATATYTYANGPLSPPAGYITNPVVGKTLQYTDSTVHARTETWTYGLWSGSGTNQTKIVTYPDGGTRKYYEYDVAGDSVSNLTVHRVGAIVEPNSDRIDRVWRKNCPIQIWDLQAGNPYVKAEFRTVKSTLGDKTSTQLFSYDRNGNLLTQSTYDFVLAANVNKDANGFPTAPVAPTGAALIRKVSNIYALDAGTSLDGDTTTGCGAGSINSVNNANAYWNSRTGGTKLDSVGSTEISDSTGIRARTELIYDSSSIALSTGNAHYKRDWDDAMAGYSNPLTDGNSIKTQYGYDGWGNITSVTDPNGIPTTYVIDKCVSSYPSAVTRAGLTMYEDWDCSSGLLKSVKDPNDVETKRTYDSLGRVSQVREAPDKSLERQANVTYSEVSGTFPIEVTTKRALTTTTDNALVTTQKTDQRGHAAWTQRPDNTYVEHLTPVVVSADQATYEAESNPYYTTGDATMGWKRAKRDRMGRVVEVAFYSGSATPPPWGSNSAISGTITTAYNGYSSTVTDESGRNRQMTADGAGRLSGVVEDPGGLNYFTKYGYDFRDNLTKVTQAGGMTLSGTMNNSVTTFSVAAGNSIASNDYIQIDNEIMLVTSGGGTTVLTVVRAQSGTLAASHSSGVSIVDTNTAQSRSFMYSSLGRLVGATNPESGTNSYRYDQNGNLLTKTDGRNIVTTYGFDDQNRLGSKQYSDGTAQATYCYDGDSGAHSVTRGAPAPIIVTWSCAGAPTGSNMKLRQTMASGGGSKARYTEFDELGRVLKSEQVTNGTTYPFAEYTYNLAGGLKSIQYPTGRVVTNSYDSAGRVASVRGTLGGVTTNYTSDTVAISYGPHGAIQAMSRGDSTQESWVYNNRLQVESIKVGPAANATGVFGVEMYYCANTVRGAGCTTNNGNLLTATPAVPGVAQNFGYDNANRLTSAAEGTGWSRSFGYDAVGNGWVSGQTGTGPEVSQFTPGGPANFDGNNRLTNRTYDGAGNQTAFGGSALTYDAENRLVSSTINSVPTVYSYDGDGRRVQKVSCPSGTSVNACTAATVNAAATTYVYDVAGQLAAEYTSGGTAGVNPCTTCYLTVDHLGSGRVLTDGSGQVVDRHDYLPFGEEIYAGINGRTTALKYPSSSSGELLKVGFGGKERDAETAGSAAQGLDYFGARYFSGAQGRFTSPDPLLESGRVSEPQSWNRYAYVLNNPLRYVDRSGLYEEDVHRDLTFALALAAGIAEPLATRIAAADQGVDDNPRTSPMGMSPAGEAVRIREAFHFTSAERRGELYDRFESTGSPEQLGIFFHAQQDSYSHAGYGPRAGHLADGHAPDKTFTDPAKSDRMADNTFSLLLVAASRLTNGGQYSPMSVQQVRTFSTSFNRARTAEQKRAILNQFAQAANENIKRQEEARRREKEREGNR